MAVRIASAILQALILVVMARSTDIEQFGHYSASLAIGAVATGLLSFGLPTRMLTLDASRGRDRGLHASAISLTLLAGAFAGLCVALSGRVVTGDFQTWSIAAGAFVASEMFCNLVQNLFFGEGATTRADAVIVLRRLVPLVAVLVGSVAGSDFVFVSATIGFLSSMLLVLTFVGRRRWTGWRVTELLRGSFHYWTASLWAMLQQLDVMIVSTIAGPAAAGGYAAAFRIASPVHIVTSSLVSRMVPQLRRSRSALEREQVSRKYMIIGLLYAASLTLLSPLAGYAGPIILGAQFEEYRLVFVLLVINSSLSVLNQLMAARLYGRGQARPVAVASGIATSVGLGAIVLGATMSGASGAALGTIAIQAVLCLLLLSTQRKRPDIVSE